MEPPAVNQIQVKPSARLLDPAPVRLTQNLLALVSFIHSVSNERSWTIVNKTASWCRHIARSSGLRRECLITLLSLPSQINTEKTTPKCSSVGLYRRGAVSLVSNIAVPLVDHGDFAGGSLYPKVQTKNESCRMRPFMILSWTRRIWTIWTLSIAAKMDLFPGTLLMLLERPSRKAR